MLNKVFLGLVLAALVVITGTAHAQQDAPYVVNGMIPVSQTAFENPGGLGDTLLYGYYNVRGFNNFFALINTDPSNGITGRIRFREAKASTEVLDFNICLSAGDAWFAIIFDNGTEARIEPFDTQTLTRPAIGSGFDFKHAANGGLATVTADDTKEGYFEFIGLVRTVAKPTTCDAATVTLGPANDVPNALAGGLYLVNPTTGEAFGYKATALANFNNVGITTAGIGQEDITLDAANGGIEAVNFALTKSHLYGAYVITDDPSIDAMSAAVVTFPTKRTSGDVPGEVGPPVVPLFDRDDPTLCLGRNVRIEVTVWDDEENKIEQAETPSPVPTIVRDLCNEVNVIEFSNDQVISDILDSVVELELTTRDFTRGYWDLDLTLETNHQTTNVLGDVTRGVPAIGYQLHRFVNGAGSMSVQTWYKTDVTLTP